MFNLIFIFKHYICCDLDTPGSSIARIANPHKNIMLFNAETCGKGYESVHVSNGNISSLFQFPW